MFTISKQSLQMTFSTESDDGQTFRIMGQGKTSTKRFLPKQPETVKFCKNAKFSQSVLIYIKTISRKFAM